MKYNTLFDCPGCFSPVIVLDLDLSMLEVMDSLKTDSEIEQILSAVQGHVTSSGSGLVQGHSQLI